MIRNDAAETMFSHFRLRCQHTGFVSFTSQAAAELLPRLEERPHSIIEYYTGDRWRPWLQVKATA